MSVTDGCGTNTGDLMLKATDTGAHAPDWIEKGVCSSALYTYIVEEWTGEYLGFCGDDDCNNYDVVNGDSKWEVTNFWDIYGEELFTEDTFLEMENTQPHLYWSCTGGASPLSCPYTVCCPETVDCGAGPGWDMYCITVKITEYYWGCT